MSVVQAFPTFEEAISAVKQTYWVRERRKNKDNGDDRHFTVDKDIKRMDHIMVIVYCFLDMERLILAWGAYLANGASIKWEHGL